jgi:microcystin-dependent protein
MSEPFIAEIKLFAGNFAPRGFAFCNGQLLPISQNTALFSLIGTTYGGDGRNTTALPDMQDRAAMHPGRGPGLGDRRLGERGGSSAETLSQSQIPSHTHQVLAKGMGNDPVNNPVLANTGVPSGNAFATNPDTPLYGSDDGGAIDLLASDAVSPVGGGLAHNNRQPYLGINFIIALTGLYPSRS